MTSSRGPFTQLAHFYRPDSEPVDGWYERLTVACNDIGGVLSDSWYNHIRRCNASRVRSEYWVHLGTHSLNQIPDTIWAKARCKQSQ